MKKYLNRLTVFLATFITVLAFTVGVNAATTNDLSADYTGKTVILTTNDVHGAIDGYQYAAGLKKELEKRGAEVYLVDCGDFSQGTTYVSESKGGSAVEMMNLVGYDFSTLGNHEFDFGPAALTNNTNAANFKVLSTNFVNNSSGTPFFDAKAMVASKDSDLKIGFIGVATPETLTKALPSNFTTNTILKENNFGITQSYVDELKTEGADIVIALTHLGVDAESEPYRSYDLYSANQARNNKIDMILDGHSHTVMEKGGNGEPIMSTGTKFNNIGVVVVDEATETLEDNFLLELKDSEGKYLEGLYGDELVSAKATEIIGAVDAAYGTTIAVSNIELNGARTGDETLPYGNRDGETNTGDLITDAMKWYVLNDGTDLGVNPDNVVVVTNGGGIRAAIKSGNVTKNDVLAVLPFGNTIAAVTVKGSELLEALEASTYSLPIGGFPQVSGIKFTLDVSAEYDANNETYPSSTYYGPKSIKRVTIDEINGKPFDAEETYVVLTNNFCAEGGDTYYVFTKASNQFDTGITMDYAVAKYIEEELGGVIDAPYDALQGRIVQNTNTQDAREKAEAEARARAEAEARAKAEAEARAKAEAAARAKAEAAARAKAAAAARAKAVAAARAKAKAAAAAKAKALAKASNINKSTVTASDIKKASKLGATKITLGKKVKRIKKNAFKGTNIKTVVVKTKKLKKAYVKGSLRGSKVKTVQVKVGNKKTNKKYVKKYKKIFTKKNAGKKVRII